MNLSRLSDRRGSRNSPTASSNRSRPDHQQARDQQAAAEDAAGRQRRVIRKREALRRQTQSAFRDSIERGRTLRVQNEQAGVEKMVRSVVRKESRQARSRYTQQTAQRRDAMAQSRYVRDKLNSIYNQAATELTRGEGPETSPSHRQQRRAIDDYQQSTRHRINRTVELII